ncbi:AGM1 [Hepatospora eriocheir]|uniref:AGM1 n=1 Tax=Hepatospora eriocheir TaxID=1081669 RepID=A0A1X0QAV5_9MICR|nr:AGM1 [Hepatospora eriocheir]
MEMFDKIFDCEYEYLDVVTTLQLQYEVHRSNIENRSNIDKSNYNLNYKECLQSLFDLQKFDDLYIDTANGSTTSFFTEDLPFKVINPQKGIINDNCGTEYVLNNKKLPFELDMNKNTPCAVFDGDGDRLALVVKNDETVTILDGDDLTVIMWDIISNNLNNVLNKLNTGVVLSYYSNGAAVNYIRDLGITCDVIGAGVKKFYSES